MQTSLFASRLYVVTPSREASPSRRECLGMVVPLVCSELDRLFQLLLQQMMGRTMSSSSFNNISCYNAFVGVVETLPKYTA